MSPDGIADDRNAASVKSDVLVLLCIRQLVAALCAATSMISAVGALVIGTASAADQVRALATGGIDAEFDCAGYEFLEDAIDGSFGMSQRSVASRIE
ncbi:hypothetical protein ACFXG4_41550 [Nocardia sp. NPDC059246]|uniref:hypothetical protein n=1 Tax=unclassified Nocardia TaxID=2637762 RepID=UPI0036CD2E3A